LPSHRVAGRGVSNCSYNPSRQSAIRGNLTQQTGNVTEITVVLWFVNLQAKYALFYCRMYDKRMILTGDSDLEGTVKKFVPQKIANDSPFRRDVTCAVYNYNGAGV